MKNLIKFIVASFVMAVLLFVSCQSDENQVVENPDVLSKSSTLTAKLKQVTFADAPTNVDNVLDSTSCFKVKFPYMVIVNGNRSLVVQSEADYAEVAAIFNASSFDQDFIEFTFPITIITLEGVEIVVEDEQEFRALSTSCEHNEVVFPCFSLTFPITISSYDSNYQIQQTHTFNNGLDLYLFLFRLNVGEFYEIRYPIKAVYPNSPTIEINSNAELLLAMETAFNICNPPIIPCNNPHVLTDGLIIYMPFANQAKDLVSNIEALPRANFPPVFVADRNGNANSAISMSGDASDFLSLPEIEVNHLKQGDSITISVWFKQQLIDNIGIDGFFEKANIWGCDGFTLGYFTQPLFGQSGGFGDPSWTPELHQDSENWHHIAITIEPENNLKIYRDGVLRNSVYYENLNIGNWLGNYLIGKKFKGYLDDLRVYRKTLTADQVQILYNLEGDTNTCF